MSDNDSANSKVYRDESAETEGNESPSRGVPARSMSSNADRADPSPSSVDPGEEEDGIKGLPLIPYMRLEGSSSAHPKRGEKSWGLAPRFALAGSLVIVMSIGAAVAYDHIENVRTRESAERQDHALEMNYAALKTRVESIETGRTHEELAELRKVLSELRAGATSARDLNLAIAQLSTRVDHVEKDQGAKLDKLGDRIDHDAAIRVADIVSRLDRLEKRPAVAAAPVPTVAPPATPKALPLAKALPLPEPEVAKVQPTVSNDVTGSVEKPKPRLRNYYIDEIRGDHALIEGPGGAQSISQGDYIPGAGRVIRFEHHGRDWIVVTSLGIIVNETDSY